MGCCSRVADDLKSLQLDRLVRQRDLRVGHLDLGVWVHPLRDQTGPRPPGHLARLGRALAVPPENVLRDWHAARAALAAAPAAALAAAPAAALAAAPGRIELTRPECGYRATFVAETRGSLAESE